MPPVARSPAELKEQIEAERRGEPFLAYRTESGERRIYALEQRGSPITIGRGEGCDIRLRHDEEVSRLHAELTPMGGHWVLADEGISRNGSYVNGERIVGKRRLRDGDVIAVGGTQILYRAPGEGAAKETRTAAGPPTAASLTATQRRVLIALCRPFKNGDPFATPATNREIADEVALSVDRVKAHLRALFERFEIEPLPHNQKRARLAERAFQSGVLSPRDLEIGEP